MERSGRQHHAGYWHSVKDERIQCDLCPRFCKLKDNQRGLCFVRQNVGGEMILTTYGRSSGFCIDPIEKKPLNHFYPGTGVLSFGTAGCNLSCRFCQNWDISKSREFDRLTAIATPQDIARSAKEWGAKSVAFTYNDPIIFIEYAIDVALACREEGIAAVAVTSGFITEEARADFFQHMDAANVDLKAFTDDFYHHQAAGSLKPVLDTLIFLKEKTNVWFEITNLLIPGANDSAKEICQMTDWIISNLGDEVPLHFTAFHPDFKMRDRPPTPSSTLFMARDIALQAGIKYVYTGNIHDKKSGSTYCPACGKMLIERDWFELGTYAITDTNNCGNCGAHIAGRFDKTPGKWGSRRLPVSL